MDLKEYAKLVKAMREAQNEYFKSRRQKLEAVANDWYKKARDLEKLVDAATTAALADAEQKSLF